MADEPIPLRLSRIHSYMAADGTPLVVFHLMAVSDGTEVVAGFPPQEVMGAFTMMMREVTVLAQQPEARAYMARHGFSDAVLADFDTIYRES